MKPAVVVRHEDCHATLYVTGRRHRGLARLEVSDTVDGALVPVPLPEASRSETVSVPYPIPTPRRGLVDVGPVRLRRRRPRRAGRPRHVGGPHRRGPRAAAPACRSPACPPARRRTAVGADTAWELGGTDLVGLHEYAMGDDLRRLHWATSARTGTLMVREDVDPARGRTSAWSSTTGPRATGPRRRSTTGSRTPSRSRPRCAGSPRTRATRSGSRTASGRHAIDIPGSPTRQQHREVQELEWLLAEIELVETTTLAVGEVDGADLAIAVSGPTADERDVRRLLDRGSPSRTVLAVVDPDRDRGERGPRRAAGAPG